MKALRIYTILYLVFLYLPVVLLPLFAFNDSAAIAFPLKGFTLNWFRDLAGITELHDAVVNSMIVAVATAVLSTVLGVFAARAASRYDFPGKTPIMGMIMLPLVLPEIIVAVSLLVLLVTIIGFDTSLLTIILGHVLICTPFAVAILSGSFQGLDRSLEEAALDLGETPIGSFFSVTLPLVTPGIVSSLLITFTISLDEFIIAFFLSGAETTLPVYIFSQLRFPARLPAVMALGTILLFLSLVLLTTAEIFRRRGIARSGAKDTGGFL